MDKFTLINIFLTVADQGSFSKASSHLGVDPSTVSKAIQRLETHLKVRLFHRTTRQLQLTTAGETYRETSSLLIRGLETCEERLHLEQDSPKGLLRIDLPVAYGQLYIMPMIGSFREAYPDINLDISLSDDNVNMVGKSIDLAIRSGQLKDSNLIKRKLSPMDFALCASPQYIKKKGPVTFDNLQEHDWIAYHFVQTGRTMPIHGITNEGGVEKVYNFEPEAVLTTTNAIAFLSACISGIGLILAPHFLIREAVDKGQLEVVLTPFRSDSFNVHAYYLNRGYVPARTRVFLDFVVNELKKISENHETTFLSESYGNLPVH